MRHRRRCQQKSRVVSKRKACASCVKAKIKCSYSKPICLRCQKRQLLCDYPIQLDSAPNDNTTEINHSGSEIAGEMMPVLDSSPEDDVYIDGEGKLGELRPDFEWTTTISPMILESPNETLNQFTFPGAENFSENHMPHLPASHALELTSNIVAILRQYPKMLLNEDYRSPFLHRELYEEVGLDMTTLTRTSMAIVCSAGLECKESRSYALRAIDAHRQSLIEEFVGSSPI
jgi:hypothetical protein